MTTDDTSPSFTITLTMADAQGFYDTGMAVAPFRDEGQYGRFECHDPSVNAPDEYDSVTERLIAAPVFDDGSLLWCDSYVGALLLAKVHRAAGFTAYVLWDMAENPPGSGGSHCVLTSMGCGGRALMP